jgi:peptidoglycan hydrolase-like protein with peptidoglycan-binding domain
MHEHVLDLAGVCTGPGPCDTKSSNRSPRENWVDKTGGLPLYIRAIMHALMRSGHSRERAIQLAVGTVKNWASGQGNVSAATRARAAKAVAEWEAKKARAHSMSASTTRTLDMAACPNCHTRLVVDLAPKGEPPNQTKTQTGTLKQNAQAAGGGGGDFNSKHPRAGKGNPTGGQFITAGSTGNEARGAEEAIGAKPDGVIDDADVAKIKEFQKANGLVVDGKIGTQTADQIREGDVRKGGKRTKVKPGALLAVDRQLLRENGVRQANTSAPSDGAVDLAGGAMPGGRFPVPDVNHLRKAVRAYGRAKPADKPKVKRHIIARAKAMGVSHKLPDKWKANA